MAVYIIALICQFSDIYDHEFATLASEGKNERRGVIRKMLPPTLKKKCKATKYNEHPKHLTYAVAGQLAQSHMFARISEDENGTELHRSGGLPACRQKCRTATFKVNIMKRSQLKSLTRTETHLRSRLIQLHPHHPHP